jgi:hypothetical protein
MSDLDILRSFAEARTDNEELLPAAAFTYGTLRGALKGLEAKLAAASATSAPIGPRAVTNKRLQMPIRLNNEQLDAIYDDAYNAASEAFKVDLSPGDVYAILTKFICESESCLERLCESLKEVSYADIGYEVATAYEVARYQYARNAADAARRNALEDMLL